LRTVSDGPTIPILKPADQITERDLNDWPQVEVLVPEENQDEKRPRRRLGSVAGASHSESSKATPAPKRPRASDSSTSLRYLWGSRTRPLLPRPSAKVVAQQSSP